MNCLATILNRAINSQQAAKNNVPIQHVSWWENTIHITRLCRIVCRQHVGLMRAEPNLMHCRPSAKFAFVMQLSARLVWKCKRGYTHICGYTKWLSRTQSVSAGMAAWLCHQPSSAINILRSGNSSVCASRCIVRTCAGDEALRFLRGVCATALPNRSSCTESD